MSEAFDQAPERATNIITLSTNNLQRTLRVIAERAKLQTWDDPWQTLRRSAETMFAMTYPQHAVSQWIGHSVAVSLKHYTMTPESLFDQAAQSRVLHAAVGPGIGSHEAAQTNKPQNLTNEAAVENARKFKAIPADAAASETGAAGIRTQNQRIMSRLLRC